MADSVGLNKGFKFYKGTCLWENSTPELFPEFHTRHEDIWICSFPRSGTTLLQEMTYLIRTLDYQTAATKLLDERVPYADVVNNDLPFYKGLDGIAKMESPRIIKTHLHYDLLPEKLHAGKGKIIYVTRNPKASVPSLYRLMNLLKTPVASSLSEFVDLFLQDKVLGCPWWTHVNGFWEHRDDDHMLFMKYEDIVQNKKDAIRTIAKFLDQTMNDKDIDKIAELTSIERMRENPMVNFSFQQQAWNMSPDNEGFIYKGEVEAWKQTLSRDLQQSIDCFMQDKLLHPGLFD